MTGSEPVALPLGYIPTAIKIITQSYLKFNHKFHKFSGIFCLDYHNIFNCDIMTAMKNTEEKVIVVASTNQGKIREFRSMLEPEGYTVKSLADLKDMPEIEENGTTFAENAVIKAQSVTDRYGIEAISDDSGLEIDAFDRQPGVHSARYLGHDTPYSYKNQVILEKMQGVENRTCRYVCAIAWTAPGREPAVFEDTVECEIAHEPRGNNGFGYDPIIWYPPFGKTMAEMTDEEKNSISHRGKAIRKLEAWLDERK